MEMKSFLIGTLTALGFCSIAYADIQIDNQGHVVSKNQVLSDNATTTTTIQSGDTTTQVIGTGAGGETNSATMDQNGQWQAPQSSSQTVTVTGPSAGDMSSTTPSPTDTTVTTPSGTTVTAPGNATVTVPPGSTVTTPDTGSVTVKDQTN